MPSSEVTRRCIFVYVDVKLSQIKLFSPFTFKGGLNVCTLRNGIGRKKLESP